MSGKISGYIHTHIDTTFVSSIEFSNLLVTKVHDTANLIQSSFGGSSAQWLQVLKVVSVFSVSCDSYAIS